MTAPSEAPRRSGIAAIWLLTGSASVAGFGGLWVLIGPGALGIEGPLAGPTGLVLTLGGVGLFAGVALSGGSELRRRVSAAIPRLYPYAGPSVQIGLFLLAVLSAASVVTALFTEYAGALQGGDSAAVPRPYVVNDLYLIASALLWAFAVWVIALMAKVVRYGRALELRTGRNVYGQVNPEEEGPFTWPKGGVPAGPALPGQGSAVLGSVLILALVAMAGMQLVELGADPPPPGAWFAIELGTPLWAAGTAAALLGIDRFVRGVEVRYAAAAPNSALASSRSASEGAAGFVP